MFCWLWTGRNCWSGIQVQIGPCSSPLAENSSSSSKPAGATAEWTGTGHCQNRQQEFTLEMDEWGPKTTFLTSGLPGGATFSSFFCALSVRSVCTEWDCRPLRRPPASLCCLLQQEGSKGYFSFKGLTRVVLRRGRGARATRDDSSYHLLHMFNRGSMHRLCVCEREWVSASALKSTVKNCVQRCFFFFRRLFTFGMLIYISSLFWAWGSHRELNKSLLKGYTFFVWNTNCQRWNICKVSSFHPDG